MGVVANIDYENYPKQRYAGDDGCFGVGARVKVCYRYDTQKCHFGKIVRWDAEEPYETIVLTDNGRILRGTECQFMVLREEELYR